MSKAKQNNVPVVFFNKKNKDFKMLTKILKTGMTDFSEHQIAYHFFCQKIFCVRITGGPAVPAAHCSTNEETRFRQYRKQRATTVGTMAVGLEAGIHEKMERKDRISENYFPQERCHDFFFSRIDRARTKRSMEK